MMKSKVVNIVVMFVMFGFLIMMLGLNFRLKKDKDAVRYALEQAQQKMTAYKKRNEEMSKKHKMLLLEKNKFSTQIIILNKELDRVSQNVFDLKNELSFERSVVEELEREKLEMVGKMLSLKIEKEQAEAELDEYKMRYNSARSKFSGFSMLPQKTANSSFLVGNKGFVVREGRSVYLEPGEIEIVDINE